jgi:wyosine [tRNA(Phe)-imidazoG37] synthetase (radical SAM superfamily)
VSEALARIIEMLCSTTVPLAIYMWANRKRAKREIEEKHEQNQKLMEEMIEERRYFPAHEHLEKSGPLTIEGMRRTGKRWT